MLPHPRPERRLPRPSEIIAAFDRVVIGQDAAKRALALAVYRHFLGLAASGGANEPSFGRQHVLLVGPTGSGKTRLVAELGKLLDVPMATCSATNLVDVGYVGDHVDGLVDRLLHAARGDPERAARGIIFVDELDKKRRSDGGSRDISGESVQEALLKLMDGVEVVVGKDARAVVIDTRGILFICAGAFAGVGDPDRREALGIGFGSESAGTVARVSDSVELDDLTRFGMIPELIGRFATIRRLHALTLPELERVLVEPVGSVLGRTTDFFARHGVELRVSAGAIRAMAERAAGLGTGARALERVATDVLEPTIWRFLQTDRRVGRIVVTQATVEHGRQAQFLGSGEGVHREEATELAARAVEPVREFARGGFTRTTGWTDAQVRERLEEVVAMLDPDGAPACAKEWWDRFATERAGELPTVLRLAEELAVRQASIAELFSAFVCADTSNIQAVLHYMDYTRLRHRGDDTKRPSSGRAP